MADGRRAGGSEHDSARHAFGRAEAPDRFSAPGEVRIAAGVMVAQAFGLVIAMAVLLIKTIFGTPDDVGRALLVAGMALAGALLLVIAARSFLAGRTGLRSPMIVIELLALPVGYSLAIEAGRVGYGGPILLSGLAVLYLLFTPAARRALERDR